MESQPQNPEFRINPENFHPCTLEDTTGTSLVTAQSSRNQIFKISDYTTSVFSRNMASWLIAINSFPATGDICRLVITLANNLDLDLD